jgi:hypothetical protein
VTFLLAYVTNKHLQATGKKEIRRRTIKKYLRDFFQEAEYIQAKTCHSEGMPSISHNTFISQSSDEIERERENGW